MIHNVNKNKSLNLNEIFPHKDLSCIEAYEATINDDGSITVKFYDADDAKLTDIPPKKKIRCTKNLVAMTSSITNRCFHQAVYKVASKHKVSPDEVSTLYSDEVDEAYRQQVCNLPTDVLESILLAHNKRKFSRANITLRAITNEIANRTILDDYSRKAQSDINNT